MKKAQVRKLVDLGMWFLFCFLLGTGLLIHYRLVPGSEGGRGLAFLTQTRHEWGELHFWASCLFLAALAIHLFLNFSFIRSAICKRASWRVVALSVAGAGIVAFFLLTPLSHEDVNGKHEHRGQGKALVIAETPQRILGP